jgi:hypothetical protein
MSLSDLETLCTAAIAAMDAGDWDTAVLKLMAIRARRAVTPDMTAATTGGGTQGIRWTPSELDSLIAECRRNQRSTAVAAGGPFRSSKITYARATD